MVEGCEDMDGVTSGRRKSRFRSMIDPVTSIGGYQAPGVAEARVANFTSQENASSILEGVPGELLERGVWGSLGGSFREREICVRCCMRCDYPNTGDSDNKSIEELRGCWCSLSG